MALHSGGVFKGSISTGNPGSYNPNINYLFDSGYVETSDDLATKSYDLGVTLGGGMQWPLSSLISLGFDIRGNMGLLSLSDTPGAIRYYGFNTNTRNLNIEAGVRLMYTLKP